MRNVRCFRLAFLKLSSINGNRFEKLSDGASSCMFKLMKGGLPKLTKVREIGLCAGELSSAMAKIDRQALPEVFIPTSPTGIFTRFTRP